MLTYDEWDRRLEQIGTDTWWMPERVHRESREDIFYTADPNGDARYSIVWRISNQKNTYEELIKEVIEAHQHTEDSTFIVTAVSYSESLVQELNAHGYVKKTTADAWTISVETPRPQIPQDLIIKRVEDLQSLKDMDYIMKACFPNFKLRDEDTLQQDLEATVGPKARCRRFIAYDLASQEPLASGALNLYPDLKLGFLWGGCTIPSARGRGVYSALVTKRMKEAHELNFKRIGIHALRGTSGPIIEKQGFVKHGPVDQWQKKFSV